MSERWIIQILSLSFALAAAGIFALLGWPDFVALWEYLT